MNIRKDRLFGSNSKTLVNIVGVLLGMSLLYLAIFHIWLREILITTYSSYHYMLIYIFLALPIFYFSATTLLTLLGLNWINTEIDSNKQKLVRRIGVFLMALYLALIVIHFFMSIPYFIFQTITHPFIPIALGVLVGVGFFSYREELRN